jgi:hypothetical protein
LGRSLNQVEHVRLLADYTGEDIRTEGGLRGIFDLPLPISVGKKNILTQRDTGTPSSSKHPCPAWPPPPASVPPAH